MNKDIFIKAIEDIAKKANMPNGGSMNLEKMCKDFSLMVYSQAVILDKIDLGINKKKNER